MTLGGNGNITAGGVVKAAGMEVTVASGDPKLVLDIGGVDKWTVGVDDDDGDKFKIHSAGALVAPSDWELGAGGNVFQGGTLLTMGLAQLPQIEVWTLGIDDPHIFFSSLTVDKWTMGLDVSDSDKFKINSGLGLADTSDLELDASGNMEIAGAIKKSTALGCRVYNSGAQTLANTTTTVVDFDTQISDTDDCWASGGDSDKLFARTAGYYMAGISVLYEGNATGRRQLTIRNQDGDGLAATVENAMGGGTAKLMTLVTGMILMDVDDYVQFEAWQNSGGNLNIRAATVAAQQFCSGWLVRVA